MEYPDFLDEPQQRVRVTQLLEELQRILCPAGGDLD